MTRRELYDLMNQRSAKVQQMSDALEANEMERYNSLRTEIENMNTTIDNAQYVIDQMELHKAPATSAEIRDMNEERGRQLMDGNRVTFDAAEIKSVINATLAGSGTLVAPSGAGSTIHDKIASFVPAIIDRVRVMDMTGLSGWSEPYVMEGLSANAGKVETLAGTARAASDPTLAVAEIKPYEVNVTAYVDRNIERLSPAAYYAKVYEMATSALRRKVAELIVKGDGNVSPVMYGLMTAKNKAGAQIYDTVRVNAVDVDLLDSLYFAYGSDTGIGPNAVLLLSKADLKEIGQLRGTNEKRRLFTITPTAGNPNTGVITDGGTAIEYIITPDVNTLTGHTPTSSGFMTMGYGDPANYLLGLFGGYSVRVSEDYKFAERLLTIAGDVMVGGNLTAHKGFVWAESKTGG